MFKEVFIRDFSTLGKSVETSISDISDNSLLNKALEDSFKENPLFTINMQKIALTAICNKFLNSDCLNSWLSPYKEIIYERNKSLGIIMAGNLPLVGFHDFLVAMACGCIVKIKLSSKDRVLLPAIFNMLCEINPYWRERVTFLEGLPDNIDVLLATGGNEASVIFENLYKHIPKIVRGSRSSIAILKGNESSEDLLKLTYDVFLYYGMGCRSVSTLLIPEGYQLNWLTDSFNTIKPSITSEDYISSYRYQKAVARMNNDWYVDGGFYLLKSETGLHPPMGVVNLITYKTENQAHTLIDSNGSALQCVVNGNFRNSNTQFGEAQYPSLSEYADGINSLDFVLNNI